MTLNGQIKVICYYEQYYAHQCGNGMNVFQGARGQRGHGLGSVLSGLFRSALPMIKNMGKQALQTGLNVATDVVQGIIPSKIFSGNMYPTV